MALIKCSECGADFSEKAAICPKCGCPTEVSIENIKDKQKELIKKIVIVVLILIIIALICFGIYKFINKPDTRGYYNGLTWEKSFDEVKEQLGDEAIADAEEEAIVINYEDYEGKTGIDALVSYGFSENTLKDVTIFLMNGEESTYTDDSIIEEYSEQLDKLYGKHEDEAGMNVWYTEKSRIEMVYFAEGCIALQYEDITRSDEVE